MKSLYRTTAVVTFFSVMEHCLGFLYRIILSRLLGSEGLGIYQASLTVFAVFLTISSSGLPITLSRTISRHRTMRNKRGEQSATTAGISITLLISVPLTLLLFLFRKPFTGVFSDPRCADLFYIFIIGLSFTSVYAILRGGFWGNKQFFAYSLIELIEEMIMIGVGVLLLLGSNGNLPDTSLAAIAVLVSYLCSFTIATCYFFCKGGKLRSPKEEMLPLFRSALPVTTMRASSSLVGSLISFLFPLRLMQTGVTSAMAMSAYGVVYGMVMPVLMIPSTLIGSIALVLVPELSEKFYKKDKKALSALVSRAINSTLLIAGILIPLFCVCGEGVGVLLYKSAESGRLISLGAVILLPMSVTMICTSILNSMNCEKQTLLFFLCGSGAMLLCVWWLPPYLGSGALLVGMGVDYTLTALCSLFLLWKKTGKLQSVGYFLRILGAGLPLTALGLGLKALCNAHFSVFPAFVIQAILLLLGEAVLFALFKLYDPRALLHKFFPKKRKKSASVLLTVPQK